jgi:hypothetical protein
LELGVNILKLMFKNMASKIYTPGEIEIEEEYVELEEGFIELDEESEEEVEIVFEEELEVQTDGPIGPIQITKIKRIKLV